MESATIYKLTDGNGLVYIGQTKQKLSQRLSEHRYDKKKDNSCYSKLLNLDANQLTEEVLEVVSKTLSYEREGYYIHNTECVNSRQNYTEEQRRHYAKLWMRKYRLELKLMSQFLKLLEEY
tara:strand:- start:55 stop:417 length:363 start_codon:yes stop_codon:yes gene_type:complete